MNIWVFLNIRDLPGTKKWLSETQQMETNEERFPAWETEPPYLFWFSRSHSAGSEKVRTNALHT